MSLTDREKFSKRWYSQVFPPPFLSFFEKLKAKLDSFETVVFVIDSNVRNKVRRVTMKIWDRKRRLVVEEHADLFKLA